MVQKKKQEQKKITHEEYLRKRVRNLPIGDCYVTAGWQDCGEAVVLVTRLHPQGTFTVGIYIVDTYCLGVKGSTWHFSVDRIDYEDILSRFKGEMVKVPYEDAHNLVYGAVAFAEEGGISPNGTFGISQYILEEDTDEVPLIEYEYGKDGKHFLCADNRLELSGYIPKLRKALGNDFLFVLPGMDKPMSGNMYDVYELSKDSDLMDKMMSALEKLKNTPKIKEETYSFEHPEYPAVLKVKNQWLADMLFSAEKNMYLADDDLERILTLPHDELRKDLESIMLYETGQTCRGISDERWNGEFNSVILHCLLLLGELRDEASLPAVLLTLCQNTDFYDYHFGDIAGDVYIPTLYLIGMNRLENLMEYMRIPGLYSFAKIYVPETVALIGVKHSERRSEVIEWFRELLSFYDGRLETCDCCDGILIGMMTSGLLNLKAVELLPELEKLYATGLVDEMCCGNFEKVSEEMKNDEAPLIRDYDFDIRKRYERFRSLLNTI